MFREVLILTDWRKRGGKLGEERGEAGRREVVGGEGEVEGGEGRGEVAEGEGGGGGGGLEGKDISLLMCPKFYPLTTGINSSVHGVE